MKKNNQYLVYDNERFTLYLGHPKNSESTRVDVTMAVSIGMKIERGDYEEVEYLQV